MAVSGGFGISGKLKQKSTFIVIAIVVLGLAIASGMLVISGASAHLWSRLTGGSVRPVVLVEIGAAAPDISAFLYSTDTEADFMTDMETLDLTQLGDIPIFILVGGESHETILRIVDTVPPTATPKERVMMLGETLSADAFVTDITDATEVSVYYKKMPVFTSPGAQDVVVVLEDRGGNKTEITSRVYIFGIKHSMVVEAGASAIELRDYFVEAPGLENKHNFIAMSIETGIAGAGLRSVGEHNVVIRANGILFNTLVTVVDTTPPSAVPSDVSVWLGRTADAFAFVSDVKDCSEVTARFKSAPDFSEEGTYPVTVILEDVWGNTAEFTASLTVIRDTIPPVISGAENRTVLLGDTVAYRSGVSAEDNADGPIEFTVDSSAVNIYAVGNYPVTYSAVDSSGNRTDRTVTISVLDLTYDLVYSMVDEILARILTPEMSPEEVVRKIHNWVRSNVRYVSNRERVTLRGAYFGLKNRQGDCFTFYAVSEVMLTRAGISNMRVTRVGGRTQHFWNLVNIGTGWYHFDTNPIMSSLNTCMFTSVDAVNYTRRIDSVVNINNYFVYDRSLYPPIVGDMELYGDPDVETINGDHETIHETPNTEIR